MTMTSQLSCLWVPIYSHYKASSYWRLHPLLSWHPSRGTNSIKLCRIFTLIILFYPSPEVPGESNPERSSRGDVSEVVDKRLRSVRVCHGDVECGQTSADWLTEAVCLEPGRHTSCPGVPGRNHGAWKRCVARPFKTNSRRTVQLAPSRRAVVRRRRRCLWNTEQLFANATKK